MLVALAPLLPNHYIFIFLYGLSKPSYLLHYKCVVALARVISYSLKVTRQ